MDHRCRPLVPRRRLCDTCLDGLRRNLAALPALYDACGHALPPTRNDAARERVSGSRRIQVVNDAAVEARMAIQALLTAWAGRVADERRLGTPGGDVAQLAGFLARQLDWVAAHIGARDLVVEVDALVAGALQAIDGDPATRAAELGACVEPGCGGRLVAHAGARAAGPLLVRCDTGRHVWPPSRWLPLRRRMEQASAERERGDRARPV